MAGLKVASLAAWMASGVASAQAPATSPASWTMTGRVVAAEDGSPLAGCTVSADGNQATGYPLAWSWLDWRDPTPVVTGADGRFQFTFPVQPGRGFGDGYPSRVELTMRAPGRVGVFGNRYLSTFFDQPNQNLGDFRLPRGAEPRIRIVDTEGKPQRRAILLVLPAGKAETPKQWFGLERGQQVRTDDDGFAALENPLLPGKYKLTVTNREAAAEVANLEVFDPASKQKVEIVVKPPTAAETAAGRVVDADGKPVADYALYAIGAKSKDGNDEWVTVKSDAQGGFELVAAGLQVGESFELKHPINSRYDDWRTHGMHPWGKRDLVVTLGPSASVDLLVTAIGKGPVEDLAVHIVPADNSTRGADPIRLAGTFAGGRVHIDGLRAGGYFVRVHSRGTRLWPSDWLECEAVPSPKTLSIELPPPVERTLHVFTDEGRPVVGGSVELIYGEKKQVLASLDHADGLREGSFYDRTMTGGRPGEKPSCISADRSTTDAGGKVKLFGMPSTSPVFVRVRGVGAQASLQELEGWAEGRGPILVTVPAGGSVTGQINPADFAKRNDVSTEEQRLGAAESGQGTNPWKKSLADLRAASRPGIALRATGDTALWSLLVAPIGDDGHFSIEGVPPGEYEVVLVMRKLVDDQPVDEIIDRPLEKVTIVAGKDRELSLKAPDVGEEVRR